MITKRQRVRHPRRKAWNKLPKINRGWRSKWGPHAGKQEVARKRDRIERGVQGKSTTWRGKQ